MILNALSWPNVEHKVELILPHINHFLKCHIIGKIYDRERVAHLSYRIGNASNSNIDVWRRLVSYWVLSRPKMIYAKSSKEFDRPQHNLCLALAATLHYVVWEVGVGPHPPPLVELASNSEPKLTLDPGLPSQARIELFFYSANH